MGKNKGKGSAAQGGGGSQLNAPSGEHLEELKASLTRYNDSFSTLLGLVPAKFYLPEEDALDRRGSQQDPADGKKLSKKQRKQLQQEQQAADGELALAKRLAKKAKYDPNTPRTVIEIQQARAAAAAADSDSEEEVGIALKGFTSAPVTAVGPEANEDEEDSPNDSDFEDDAADDEDIAASTAVKAKTGKSTAGVSSAAAGLADVVLDPQALAGATGESSREALLAERKKRGEVRDKRRERTRERKRKERDGAAAPGDVPASVSLKRKREEEAAAFRASGMASGTSDKVGKAAKMSDVKKALKKEGRRQPPVQMADSGDDDDTRMDTSAARAGPSVPATKASAPATSSSALATSSGPANPASIAFSSLDFTPSSAVGGPDAPKLTKKQREALGKNTRMGVTSHDPAVALNALKGREEFLSKLTPQARERAEEKDKWERMAMRAEGTKVYDEEAKLKKMVKRREKAKDKSRKDWADRKETLENTQAAQQKKRQENINARLQQRKDKKSGTKPKTKSIGKQNPKKAKGRPGFEGKGGGSKK